MPGFNQTAAISANFGGVLLLVSLLASSKILWKKNKTMRLLRVMFIISIIGCAADMIYVLVDGKLFFGSVFINNLVKSFNNIETTGAGLLFIWYINLRRDKDYKWQGPLKVIAIAVMILSACCLIINPKTHILYTIDERNVYTRGPWGQVGFIIAMCCVLYTVVIIIRDDMQNRDYLPFPIVQYVFPFIVGGTLQMTLPALRLSNIAFVLSLLTVYFNILTISEYEDEIPGIYNDVYLSYFFSRTNRLRRMAAYGGISFLVPENMLSQLADVLKRNKKAGTILIRHEKNGILLLKENADLEEMDKIIQIVRDSFSEDSDHIKTGMGVYFSNSNESEYFLRSLKLSNISYTA